MSTNNSDSAPATTRFEKINLAATPGAPQEPPSDCEVETYVRKYFGLDETATETTNISTDFGDVVNLIAMFREATATTPEPINTRLLEALKFWIEVIELEFGTDEKGDLKGEMNKHLQIHHSKAIAAIVDAQTQIEADENEKTT